MEAIVRSVSERAGATSNDMVLYSITVTAEIIPSGSKHLGQKTLF